MSDETLSELLDLYRKAPAEEPGTRVDATILRAARRRSTAPAAIGLGAVVAIATVFVIADITGSPTVQHHHTSRIVSPGLEVGRERFRAIDAGYEPINGLTETEKSL